MIMKKAFLFYAFVLSIAGCSTSTVSIDQLILKKGRYYAPGSGRAFTGEATLTFDNGTIAGWVQFKNGVPDGRWVAYGYEHEIVQEGSYVPVSINSEAFLKRADIIRFNLCKTKEGKWSFTDAFIVTNTPGTFAAEAFKPQLEDYLRRNGALIQEDTLN